MSAGLFIGIFAFTSYILNGFQIYRDHFDQFIPHDIF